MKIQKRGRKKKKKHYVKAPAHLCEFHMATEMSTGNLSWGGKGGRCVELTTLPPSCADCLKTWKPRPPGALRAFLGLYGTALPFFLQNCIQLLSILTEQICFTLSYNHTDVCNYICTYVAVFIRQSHLRYWTDNIRGTLPSKLAQYFFWVEFHTIFNSYRGSFLG
jgi:hypothetical protein